MKCMLVEDGKMSRMILKKIIGTAHPDWEITAACDAQVAVNFGKQAELDIILLDHNMPVMTGTESAEIISPLFPKAKIALLTANIQQSIQKLASDLKIDFIPKIIIEVKIINYVG